MTIECSAGEYLLLPLQLVNTSHTREDYLCLLLFLAFSVTLTLIILASSYLLAKQNPEAEKLSPYECGFEPYEDARHTFDIQFYITSILFILFDIEIMFMVPWSSSLSQMDALGVWSMMDFILELLIGLFYAWYVGALDWS